MNNLKRKRIRLLERAVIEKGEVIKSIWWLIVGSSEFRNDLKQIYWKTKSLGMLRSRIISEGKGPRLLPKKILDLMI